MNDLVNWAIEHQAVVAGVGVAILDLVFALNQSATSNGLLHWFYVKLKAISGGNVK